MLFKIKLNKMKKIIIVLLAICAMNLSYAQDMVKVETNTNTAYNQLNKLLHFTSEQQEKVKELIYGVELKNENIRISNKLTEVKKEEFQQKNKEVLQSIMFRYLNDEQDVKYKIFLSKK